METNGNLICATCVNFNSKRTLNAFFSLDYTVLKDVGLLIALLVMTLSFSSHISESGRGQPRRRETLFIKNFAQVISGWNSQNGRRRKTVFIKNGAWVISGWNPQNVGLEIHVKRKESWPKEQFANPPKTLLIRLKTFWEFFSLNTVSGVPWTMVTELLFAWNSSRKWLAWRSFHYPAIVAVGVANQLGLILMPASVRCTFLKNILNFIVSIFWTGVECSWVFSIEWPDLLCPHLLMMV